LLISGYTLNLFSLIGFVLLMGLAKKNSIVLVDFASRLQAEGADATAAMQRAAPVRLRPILMTSVATIVAAIPIAIGLGPGGEIRAPMAMAIIGGMIVATTLSLLVVPAVYVLIDRAVLRIRRGKTPKTISGSSSSDAVTDQAKTRTSATATTEKPVRDTEKPVREVRDPHE